MALSLSTDDLARLEVASRTLVSPLAVHDIDVWRQEAMRAVRDLLGARGATFGLPGTGGAYFLGDEADESVVQGVETYLGPTWSGTGCSPSAPVDLFHQTVVGMGLEAWDFEVIDHIMQGGATQFDYYYEVMVPGRITDTQTLFVPTPEGSVMLEVHDLQRPLPGGSTLPLLRALVPSLRAGVSALQTLSAHRTALATTLDAVAEPLAAFDADGRELYRNAALARLLAEEPESTAVEVALGLAVRSLRRLVFPRRGEGPGVALGAPAGGGATTARGHYGFRPAVLPEGLLGAGGAFLVSVQADLVPQPPSEDEVRARFGLTRREAEVGLLLATGLRNDEIADKLFIAPGTTRRHTEGIFAKLEVGTRAAAAAKLLSAA